MLVSTRFVTALRVPLSLAGRILLVACLLLSAAASVSAATPLSTTPGTALGPQGPTAPYLVLENMGQYTAGARFLLKQGDQRIWLTDDAVWLTVPDPAATSGQVRAAGIGPGRLARRDRQQPVGARSGTALRFTFPGANPAAALEPFGRVPTHVSYLIGNDPSRWQREVPVWSGVRYRDLYPGVDLVIGGDAAGPLPWRLEARSGANLQAVTLRVEGAERVAAVADQLRLEMLGRAVDVALPTWSLAGQTSPIGSAVVRQSRADAFTVSPALQPQRGQAIAASASEMADAGDLIYEKLLGGTADDTAYGIAVDYMGNAYVTGLTRAVDFPVTPGHHDNTNDDDTLEDAFVVKVNAAGNAVVYVTYLGGAGREAGFGIAVAGDLAYVAGETDSPDFAGTTGTGDKDIFVAALNATGTDVRYVRRLAGSSDDTATGISLEGLEAYVVGTSSSADLPAATNCPGDTGTNLVVAKLNASGAPLYTTCMAGSNNEGGAGIAVRNGVAYVTGDSSALDYSTSDMLVASFAANGTLSNSKLIGGSSYDWGSGIAVAGDGSLYVAGGTWSSPAFPVKFPVTPGTRAWGGGVVDAVVLKLLPSQLTIDGFATYLGGSSDDEAIGIAVDTVQALYVVGTTSSANFPTRGPAYSPAPFGEKDLFLARMHIASGETDKVTYATYLGGAEDDYGFGVATDTGGHAFVTGVRELPTESNESDALVAKLKVISPPDAPVVTIAASSPNAVLEWDAVPSTSNYQVFRSSMPYFTPGDWSSALPLAEPTVSPNPEYPDGVLSQVNAYFYLVKAVSAAPEASASSNEVGKFTFQLVPGSN